MAIAIVELTDTWAVRELTICIRSLSELPPYARQLVEHLRAGAAGRTDPGRSTHSSLVPAQAGTQQTKK
jgi:hypothetical protein